MATASPTPASTLNDAWETFKSGLGSVLRQWTALALAVENNWGGGDSSRKADVLCEQLIHTFKTSKNVYRDDIDDYLCNFLEDEFSTVIEDGSSQEVAALLIEIFERCGKLDFALVNRVLERERNATTSAKASVALKRQAAEGDDGSSSSSDDEAMSASSLHRNPSLETTSAATANAEEESAMDEIVVEEQQQRQQPPDPDGWETVKPKRGSRRRG